MQGNIDINVERFKPGIGYGYLDPRVYLCSQLQVNHGQPEKDPFVCEGRFTKFIIKEQA